MSGPARRPARGSCWCALRSRRNLPGVQHPMQVRCRDLDVIVLVLARAAFRSEHATAVDIFEVPIGKFVVSLGLVRLFVVDTQIPLAVFGKAVEANDSFASTALPNTASGIWVSTTKSRTRPRDTTNFHM